jgi:carbonic anhydrase
MTWLDAIVEENENFREAIDTDVLPTKRQPYPYGIVTCMDPRVNLAAAGALPFLSTGEIQSHARIIRTLGGMADKRSLVVGIHLAGLKEVAVIMHTDCGCSLAYSKVDTLIANIETNLHPVKWQEFKNLIGEPIREKLIEWLHAFEDPWVAVKKEVEAIKSYPFVPETLIVHGLVYDLSSGTIEIVINGYDAS